MRNKDLKAGDKIQLIQGNRTIFTTVLELGDAAIRTTSDHLNNNIYFWNAAESDHPFVNRRNMWEVKLIKEEENMENPVKEEVITDYGQLKPGDRLRITREIEVSSVNRYDGIRSKDNRVYRVAGQHSGLPGFNIVRLTPVKVHPENWPPQIDDVWEQGGRTYHIHHNISGSVCAFTSYGVSHSLNVLDNSGSKLVYRKGNTLR